VVVLATLGAPQRRLLRGRRPSEAPPQPEPAPVTTARATVIETAQLGEDEADAWLSSGPAGAAEEALEVLAGTVHAHRLAAADPGVPPVSLERALVVRVGYGNGEQVAEGRWARALELPPAGGRRGRRRVAALRPQERLAALLTGRDEALACEALVLRAREDLDAGRWREAALQVRVALEAALAELERSPGAAADMTHRVGELRDQRGPVGAAANAALEGELEEPARQAVQHALERLEAALRARSAAGFANGDARLQGQS
jgi:hypothetical protein